MDDRYYEAKREAALRAYQAQSRIFNPFFNDEIILGPEGFRHLSRPTQGERTKDEQIQRFTLLPLALHVLKTATTLQAYRRRPAAVGIADKGVMVQWWGFVALFVKQRLKVRVVVRKVGDDPLHFWSVMLYRNRSRRRAPKYAKPNR